MLLNVRLSADSIPSALTKSKINNLDKIPTKLSNSQSCDFGYGQTCLLVNNMRSTLKLCG